jgi:glycerol-3-phosphate dehydrogenase
MHTIETEILVIGGGATGTGVLRDLALRGFKALLVDKSDLTQGTTGRYHGLLHSGGRYCVKDPLAAHECIEENAILRRIMPQCIEDTGGFFVITPWDDPGYAERFLRGCQEAGIPVEELSIPEMLRLEPLLNPRILRCFRVPDGSADSFLGAHLNVESARQYGAQALTYHRVERLTIAESGPRRVTGALCYNLVNDQEVFIQADMVVNAAGAWAGRIAATAGLEVSIIPGKGTMLAMNHRIVNTVINRCRLPSDGDILVPAHTVSVIGTTDIKVSDPDHFAIEPWEVNLCLEEGDKLVPGFKNMRMLRAWAGVRPLYQDSAAQSMVCPVWLPSPVVNGLPTERWRKSPLTWSAPNWVPTEHAVRHWSPFPIRRSMPGITTSAPAWQKLRKTLNTAT